MYTMSIVRCSVVVRGFSINVAGAHLFFLRLGAHRFLVDSRCARSHRGAIAGSKRRSLAAAARQPREALEQGHTVFRVAGADIEMGY